MAFADILELVGSTSRFQVIHVTLLSVPIMMLASHNLLQNFAASVPPHYCRAPTNSSVSHLDPKDAVRVTVPLDVKGQPLKCQRYSQTQWHLLASNSSSLAPGLNRSDSDSLEQELQGCDDGWEYIPRDMTTTIITEWDLVCGQRSLKQMGQSVYMGGVLVGAAIFGQMADMYGRRKALVISYLLMAIGGTCAAFAPSFILFCIFRFVCGIALSGIVLNSLALVLEWIPTRVRTVVGTTTGYFYTTGQIILAGVAYLIQDWRWLILVVSLPFYVFFFYSWWFLESGRWLMVNGNPEQAVKNLRTVARINGRKTVEEKIDVETVKRAMGKELSCSKGKHSSLDLFRTSTMRATTLCLGAVWFSTSFGYYALSMDLQNFGVSIYLIQVIFGAVDIPAKIIIAVMMSKIGRRFSQSASLILAGVCILVNLSVPQKMMTLRTSLAVIGKACFAGSFSCCYLYSGELYPTVIRQTGMGLVSMLARLGAMVAPLVELLRDRAEWLPGLIFGAAPIISGVAAVFLPETMGLSLPDTIQDVENRRSMVISQNPFKHEEMVLKNTEEKMVMEPV